MSALLLDPEVQADLDLRDSSERDRTRTRKPATWDPPLVVASWPCRRPRCVNVVEVTQTALESLETFNAQLRARGEREIPTDAIALCDDCRREAAKYRADALRERHDKLRDVIRALRKSPTPRSEHDLIRKLEEFRHPDVKGLLDALDAKLNSSPKRAREI